MKIKSFIQQPRTNKYYIIILGTLLLIIISILIGYFNGTGFNSSDQITTTRVISGPSVGTVTQTTVHQSGKTLWDLLQLLIIPAALTMGGAFISLTISKNEREATNQRDKTEREIAEDNQREVSLQSYIDKMSELLLEKELRSSKPTDEIQKIARVRTLTILSRLDPERKKNLLQFLYEERLIDGSYPIVDLKGSNLRSINLSHMELVGVGLRSVDLHGARLLLADLHGSDLSNANLHKTAAIQVLLNDATLCGANLSEAILLDANLRGANLRGANLGSANLRGADLRGVDLDNAHLGGADMHGVNLRDANLSGANLTGVDLRGADLRGVRVDMQRLEKAKSLEGATMPKGSVHP